MCALEPVESFVSLNYRQVLRWQVSFSVMISRHRNGSRSIKNKLKKEVKHQRLEIEFKGDQLKSPLVIRQLKLLINSDFRTLEAAC